MKNIHVLPTEKPSRLFDCFGKLFIGDFNATREDLQVTNQYIYITSDEEIKEGDWYLDTFNNQRIKANEFSDHKHYGNACKKIILTTDQDLIKDGVQAIDDEFLEWFVKNPSCEGVELVKEGYKKNGMIDEATSYRYKIIIPQEEPNRTHYLDELPNIDKKILAKMWEDAVPKLEPKQETLENESIFKNKKWYSENGTVYNEADDSVRIALVFDNGSYMNLPIEIANKISQLLNN
jgi:hypothetical protein